MIKNPFLSTICVTLPPTCAIQLIAGSNSLLSTCTLPWISAARMPNDEEQIVASSLAFYIWVNRRKERYAEVWETHSEKVGRLAEVMCVFDGDDVKERELFELVDEHC